MVARTFVFGEIHEGAKPDWFLHIDVLRDVEFSLQLVTDNVIRHVAGQIQHDILCCSDDAKWDRVFATDKYLSATLLLVKGFAGRHGWFQNRCGGMCPNLHRIIKRKPSEDFPPLLRKKITVKDIKFSQWANGTHWYARLPDGTDVEWEGQSKWSTHKAATIAAKKFLAC